MLRTSRSLVSTLFFLVALTAGIHLQAQNGIYDRIGIVPGHGSHGSLPEENIDLFTGNVTLRYRDVYLPGPYGLDVEVWRVYNSKILTDWQPGQQPAIQAYHQSWVGMGWTMHMGMVHAYSSNAPVIEFPDGRLERAYPNNCGLGANVYMTRDFLKYDKTYFYPGTYPKVYFKDGVVWTLGLTATITRADGSTDPVRLVTKIDSSFGQSITIEYNTIVAGQYPTLKKITDAFGRIITFTSSGTPRKLTQISYTATRQYAQSQVRRLYYSVGAFGDGSGYTRLNSFQPPEIAPVQFEYENGDSDHYELKKMTTSFGGTLEYSINDHLFYSGSTQLNSRVMTQKRIKFTTNPAEVPSTWNYVYPDYNGVPTGMVNIDGPVFDTSVSYNAYDPASPWRQGLIQALGYGDGSYQESYEWTSHEISSQVFAPLPASALRHKEGGAVFKEETLYEIPSYTKYGLPSKVLNYIGGSETPLNYRTVFYNFAGRPNWELRYMLAYPSNESQFSGSGMKLKGKITTYYDDTDTWKWGAIKKISVWKEDSTYAEWTHSLVLDTQGKKIQVFITGPLIGSNTEVVYSYGLEEQLKKGDVGSVIRTISPYDSAISRESYPTGGVLNYTYDLLGRVIAVDWPTGRYDESITWPAGENRSISTRGATGSQHILTKFWDGMGRDLGSTDQGDGTTLYFLRTLDAEGRLLAECKGSTSEDHDYHYSYNAVGEVVEIADPEGHTTQITLNGTTKTVEDPEHHSTVFEYEHLPGFPTEVTDPQGHIAEYAYDVEGRLTEVDYNDGARIHSFEYDRNDNLTSETHPETGLISYVYNDENWLMAKTWGASIIHYSHNGSGQLYAVYSGEYPDYEEQIMYTYVGGKLIRVRSTVKGWDRDQIQYDSCGNLTHERITIPPLAPKDISYVYDGFNNLSMTTYPDQHWSLVGSNGLGMPETLAFDSPTNYLVGSASYGSGKAVTGLAFTRNGTHFSASYFPSGHLSQTSLTRSGVTLYDASYQYDGNGNIQSISSTAPAPSMNAAFGYDSLNRLTTATYSSGRVGAFGYTYDEYGNMRTVRENGISVFDKTYDSGNRITGDSYDARGNLLTAMGEDAFYHWDKMNQLSSVSNTAGGILGKYLYDERGLRLAAMPPLPDIDIYLGPPSEGILLEDGIGTVTLDCPVNQHVDATLTIKNEGDGLLELTGSQKILITGPNADQFTVFTEPSSPIAPWGGTTTFVIRFSPTSVGKKTAAISIANNDLDENPYDIGLTGNLEPPEINIVDVPDGGTWDFGTVQVGQSQQWPFMIQNLGEEDLVLDGNPRVQISGDEMGQFSVEEQPSGVVTGHSATFLVIRFSPMMAGPATAQVSIQNNDSDENPYNFTLTGEGQGGLGMKQEESGLDIIFPDGDDTLVAGKTRTIAWRGAEAKESVKIEYSTDNGSTYRLIAERAPNTGRFEWLVPPDLSPACLIRLSAEDGVPVSPRAYAIEFDLKTSPAAGAEEVERRFSARAAIPGPDGQTTWAWDFTVAYEETEAEATGEVTPPSGWRHFRVVLDMDKVTGSVSIDDKPLLVDVLLVHLAVPSDRPEIHLTPTEGVSAKLWVDNLEIDYEDRTLALQSGDRLIMARPVIRDGFDRYAAGAFPEAGGWKIGWTAASSEGGSVAEGGDQADKQSYDQGIVQPTGTASEIDESERVSPLRSFRIEQTGEASSPVVKKFAMPERLPYDVSTGSFSIVAEDAELAGLMDRMLEERAQPETSPRDVLSGNTPQAAQQSPAPQGGGSMMTLSVPRTGSFYIYSFDGRLLAEYDIYGTCLRDYIYMGSRLVAEFVPATGQYFYYMQDQIGSTRVVTDDTGTVVYAEAHDPYGGIQKTWVSTFDPKRKFSDKERDGETGLDYFGARYYSSPSSLPTHHAYRFISVDPLLIERDNPHTPVHWNLYAFCLNNPISYVDPLGRAAENTTINIFLGFDANVCNLDMHKLMALRAKGYKIEIHYIGKWTWGDFRKSAGAENTWTFYLGDSTGLNGRTYGLFTDFNKSSITLGDPISTQNKFVGIFACRTSIVAGFLFESTNPANTTIIGIRGTMYSGIYGPAQVELISQLAAGKEASDAVRSADDVAKSLWLSHGANRPKGWGLVMKFPAFGY